MKRYLIDITFIVGSDDIIEDTDEEIYLFEIKTDEDISGVVFANIFNKVNDMLNNDINALGISYIEGLNIYTLIKGVEIYFEGDAKITQVTNDFEKIDNIDNEYSILQWQ